MSKIDPRKSISVNLYYNIHGFWQCDINSDTGHHAIADTPDEALLNATTKWCNFRKVEYEKRIALMHKNRNIRNGI